MANYGDYVSLPLAVLTDARMIMTYEGRRAEVAARRAEQAGRRTSRPRGLRQAI